MRRVTDFLLVVMGSSVSLDSLLVEVDLPCRTLGRFSWIFSLLVFIARNRDMPSIMPLRVTDRTSRARPIDMQPRRRSDRSLRWQKMRRQWKLEAQAGSKGRTSQASSQPDLQTAAHLETSSKLDVIDRQVETLAFRQNETENTANDLVSQLESTLSSTNGHQIAFAQNGEAMTARQKMSEEVGHQLAIQQE